MAIARPISPVVAVEAGGDLSMDAVCSFCGQGHSSGAHSVVYSSKTQGPALVHSIAALGMVMLYYSKIRPNEGEVTPPYKSRCFHL